MVFVSSKSVKAIKSYGNLNIGILVQFLEERHCINVLQLGVKCGTKMLGFKWIFEHKR
jgi:hypothetical protein